MASLATGVITFIKLDCFAVCRGGLPIEMLVISESDNRGVATACKALNRTGFGKTVSSLITTERSFGLRHERTECLYDMIETNTMMIFFYTKGSTYISLAQHEGEFLRYIAQL